MVPDQSFQLLEVMQKRVYEIQLYNYDKHTVQVSNFI